MVGDVNLFLNSENKQEAELEVMIAEPSARRKGFGKEAVQLMMRYGYEQLNVAEYIVKIGVENLESTNLFLKFGFQNTSYSEYFKETTYSLDCSSEDFKTKVLQGKNSYLTTGFYDLNKDSFD